MNIDSRNWFEIVSAIVVLYCWLVRPTSVTRVLAPLLLISVCVELSSKLLLIEYYKTHNKNFITAKLVMYSLFNIIKFCCSLFLVFFLLNDKKNIATYVKGSCLVIGFVVLNLIFFQGYYVYNNYSNCFGILVLIAITLYKLINFENFKIIQSNRTPVMIYLFLIVFFYTINFPFFVFYQQMFTEDQQRGVVIYRSINGSANYIFYAGLALATILFTFGNNSTRFFKSKAISNI